MEVSALSQFKTHYRRKGISESRFQLRVGDMLILMSDGVINAGMGKLTDGWPLEDVISFVEDFYTPDLSPQRMATRLLDACNSLYMDHTDDDVTIAVYKIRARQAVNVLFGPPEHKEDDERILRLFFWQGRQAHRLWRQHSPDGEPLSTPPLDPNGNGSGSFRPAACLSIGRRRPRYRGRLDSIQGAGNGKTAAQ